MKQKITWIMPQDLNDVVESCKKDKDGNYIVPEHIELYLVPTPEERKQAEIEELETQFNEMTEPTDEELIDEGKMVHPYYDLQQRINYLKTK